MVGALGEECNPRCYEKCLLCVPQMKDFNLMSIHTCVDVMKPFLKGISFDVPDSTRELHEPFGTEMKKCLSRIQSVRVIMKARASWMSLTRI